MSDDLCNMKIKNLRNLAKENNINVRDDKGKLKNKCKLMIEIIKKKYMNLETQDDELDIPDIIVETIKPKVLRFGDVSETIVETENIPGRKSKNTTKTRRTLSDKELKNFKPSEMSGKRFKKSESEKQKSEMSSMEMEDVNTSNDYPKYKTLVMNYKNNSIRVAKLKDDSLESPFKIFEIKNFNNRKSFSLKSKNPIAIFDLQSKTISKILDKPAVQRIFGET